MVVYKITNSLNGKVYIGATKRSLAERWSEHKRGGENPNAKHKLYKDMYKYGEENFSICVLEECDTLEELYEKEAYYIDKYDAIESGYNTFSSAPAVEDWEEVYAHLREVMQSGVNKKISDSMKKYRKEHPFSEKHRQRLSESAMGNKNGEGNPSHSIACYCTGKYGMHEFSSYKEAGIWWYNTCKPFGDTYSEATYQRKIKDCIKTGRCVYRRPCYREIVITKDEIKWFKNQKAR